MNKLIVRFQKARLAIVSGDTEAALNENQEFSVVAERFPPEDAETKARIRSALAELEVLAKASMEGTKVAI